MTRAIILSQIQTQMEAAVECIQEERHAEAIGHFTECAKLTELLQMEKTIPASKKPKQLTIELDNE